jgi:hypothetical protein
LASCHTHASTPLDAGVYTLLLAAVRPPWTYGSLSSMASGASLPSPRRKKTVLVA